MSELIKSPSCQSGPASRSTTFLPALARTAANAEPEAPAPTMTTSTLSLFAISPAPRRRDVRLIGHAEMRITIHGAVNHVHCVATQQEIHKAGGGAFPAIKLVLPHQIDELVLLVAGELRKIAAAIARRTRAIDRTERSAIEIRKRRFHVHDPSFEQRLLRRDRDLLIDEMNDAGVFRAG